MASAPKSRYADVTGDGTGNHVAIGDYSAAQTIFRLAPGAGQIFEVERMIVYIRDTGAFDANKYGNNTTLTNGIIIQVVSDTPISPLAVEWDITDNDPIMTNSEWKKLCHDEIPSSYGVGDESITYRYTFSRDGKPITLEGDNGDEFRIILEDDFTGLNDHTFRIGFKEL